MYFKEVDMRTHLQLHGEFSHFPSCKPLDVTLNDNEVKVLAMTPEGPWNAHNEAYKTNEENIIDSEGQIIERGARVTILLENIEE